jgi:hypothetical protein
MKRLPHLCLGLALLVGATAWSVAPARAETRVAISPSFLFLEAKADTGGSVEVQVTNRGDEPLDLSVGVTPYEGIEGERSAMSWISVDPNHLHVEPGEAATVEVHIAIPDREASGGRYAAVAFTTAAPDAGDGNRGISARLLVPVWLAVEGKGDLTRVPTVERFAPVLEADGRIGFRAAVRNEGNVHTRVAGAVEVGPDGEQPNARLEFQSRGILPDGTEVLATQGSLPLPAGALYAAEGEFAPPKDADQDAFDPISTTAAFGIEPMVAIVPGSVCENLDRGPTLSGAVVNDGDLGVLPIVQFEVRDASGTVLGYLSPTLEPVAWPHDQVEFAVDLPERLVSGNYTLITRVMYGAGEQVQREASFSIGGDPATAAPLCANPTLD